MIELLALLTGANVAHAQVATSTIEGFFDGIVDQGFDQLFYVLELIFPVLLTIGIIALVWGVARGILRLRG